MTVASTSTAITRDVAKVLEAKRWLTTGIAMRRGALPT